MNRIVSGVRIQAGEVECIIKSKKAKFFCFVELIVEYFSQANWEKNQNVPLI